MKPRKRSFFIFSLTAFVLFFLIPPLYANVIQVTNSNDSGVGSFREALYTAFITPEADTIVFAPGLADKTLFLEDQLAVLPGNLTIDGTNAPVIDGSTLNRAMGLIYSGLQISNEINITISGLRLNGFEVGIEIFGAVSNITVETRVYHIH